ncbi:MAG: PorT family protein [Bacteroides sp.]|nr:PorT family protein [Bacteroides sp.]MCM1378918.1 PorT family protein [Bacteroides sp.]MCM1445534.1 PorT family protein [Prevotella sp.]
MKKIIARVVAAVIACAASLTAAAGPFQFGIVAGMNVNSISTSNFGDTFSADNRCGFAGGVMAKFTVPIINIGADIAALYEYRTMQMDNDGVTDKLHYSYLAVPLHVRYDIPMPAISSIFFPTIYTGPNFAFRLGNGMLDDYKANKYNIGWDFGLGITLVKHVQISAAYTLGISSKAVSFVGIDNDGANIKGKTNGWTITAAYLF